MNWENIEGNWNDFHGKLIQQWSKLTSDDVNQVRGRRDALLGKLQERYGISRQLAENQIEDWMRRVGALGRTLLRAATSASAGRDQKLPSGGMRAVALSDGTRSCPSPWQRSGCRLQSYDFGRDGASGAVRAVWL
jgi:uncharacterized protein YjbJ (UPF0337 family)